MHYGVHKKRSATASGLEARGKRASERGDPRRTTPFDEAEEIDLVGQRRVLDFLIDAGVDGICILANYSEQFAVTDAERERLTDGCLEHVAGRVPVIVTTSHFSQKIAAERSRRAQEAGAGMVMVMPPYHGSTIRPEKPEVLDFFRSLADAIDIPNRYMSK